MDYSGMTARHHLWYCQSMGKGISSTRTSPLYTDTNLETGLSSTLPIATTKTEPDSTLPVQQLPPTLEF